MSAQTLNPTQLAPQFNFITQELNSDLQDLLLSQDRLCRTYLLANKQTQPLQHLYVYQAGGSNWRHIMQALDKLAKRPVQYLGCEQGQYQWHQQPPSEVITTQQSQPIYIRNQISIKQLFGSLDNGSMQLGQLFSASMVWISADCLLKQRGLARKLFSTLEQGFYQLGQHKLPISSLVGIVGNYDDYANLKYSFSDFNDCFTLFAEQQLDGHQLNHSDYQKWLQQVAKLYHCQLEPSAYAPLMTYASKLSEQQNKLSLQDKVIGQLLEQAKLISHSNIITGAAISLALKEAQYRANSQQDFSLQSFTEKFVHLATTGEMVGQINALTVIDSLDHSFGEPARVTASVHYGDGEVADIERKSDLAGNIHAKGMMILTACLYRIFATDAPLHLSANIVFEQSYQEIDGDSASLAEYCALISAITEQPIKQSLAITGAIDQFGNVQAIGGVNEKIEGFYNLCAARELDGHQGVIIPSSNICQLNLAQEVIDAVTSNKFTIYAVDHIDQAVPLLMSCEAGKADKNQIFHKDSLYGRVQNRLAELAGHLDEEPSLLDRLVEKVLFWR
ncbi:S16 family serine protease [Paraferrimonas sp. SM1919]|uniref:S16 family serine protease n=1 Tax=Paraferrimonas sp. SM1919 TaxID=2662263 RepID=UPI0013D850C8|nr:S16 family serine protease [Paraferrimonas sp. SM1919]